MWQSESESKYSNYFNSKRSIVNAKITRGVFGGRCEIPSPNYGATAPVIHNPHRQLSASRLPLKMVVSDVVHRDFGPLQQPSPTPSRFIVTPKKRSNPYDCYKNVLHRHSHTSRNHPIVDEMQKKFNSIYGNHFQNAASGTPSASTSLAPESPMGTDSIEQESSIPKFSNFYKEYLRKQQSASEEMKISDSHEYCNSDKYTPEGNEIENHESNKCNTNKGQEHFMLAKNFLHTIEEKQAGSEEGDDSPSKYSKNKSEEEYSSSSSQEYCSQNYNFHFSPMSKEKKEGPIPDANKMIPQTWTLKNNSATADSTHSAGDNINILAESPISDTSEEDTNIWFPDEDCDEDLK